MPNKLDQIRNKVFKKEKEWNVVDTWHYLMLHYGYIPFDDFLSMDATIVNKLMENLNKLNTKKQLNISNGSPQNLRGKMF